jgi:chromate reductase
MYVLGLCGSLRRGSYNRRLLAAAANELPESVTFEVYEGLAGIPPYDEDLDTEAATPAVVKELQEAIAAADAVLIATPKYNASVPGHLKNALDWASRPFPDNALRDRPVAVVGASTGLFGAVWAQAEPRKVLGTIGAHCGCDLTLGEPFHGLTRKLDPGSRFVTDDPRVVARRDDVGIAGTYLHLRAIVGYDL